jgi:acetyl/propionyl-CoA carboxylase alpha subunit
MPPRTILVAAGGAPLRVDVADDGGLVVDGVALRAEPVGPHEWRVVIEGRIHRVLAAGPAEAPWLWCDGVVYRPEVSDAEHPARRRQDAAGSLAAPMPATVRAIAVSVGDRVSRGDTLIVLEAMKMELPVKAPADGTVTRVACSVGELVQPGVALVEVT